MATPSVSELPVYPTRFRQPFADPLQALCQAYHVGQPLTLLAAGAPVPDTIDMEVIYAAQMPTHALVILNASGDAPGDAAPIIAPIDIFAFNEVFNLDILRLPERTVTPLRDSRVCVPHLDSVRNSYAVSLPTLTVHASDPASVPLLLLFALWDYLPSPPPPDPSRPPSPALPATETAAASPRAVPSTPPPTPNSTTFPPPVAAPPAPAPAVGPGLLATYLLPTAVIEEFPAAPAMAEAMARTSPPREVAARARANARLWQNALAFAPKDDALLAVVRIAWEVAREAHKMLERHYDAQRARRAAKAAAAAAREEQQPHTRAPPTQTTPGQASS